MVERHPRGRVDPMTPRTSHVAYVLIRLRVDGQDCLLLREHSKWRDWSLVGGHVEPDELHDWAIAARREASEELAPLVADADFTLHPWGGGPEVWGPEPSKSVGGVPTIYRAKWYFLTFRHAPSDCLSRLPRGEFLLASFDAIEATQPDDEIAGLVRRLSRQLRGGLGSIPLAWPDPMLRDGIGVEVRSSSPSRETASHP